MTLLRTALAFVAVLSIVACGTVDLEKDPLLKPPQLIDSDGKPKKKSAALPTVPTTAHS